MAVGVRGGCNGGGRCDQDVNDYISLGEYDGGGGKDGNGDGCWLDTSFRLEPCRGKLVHDPMAP